MAEIYKLWENSDNDVTLEVFYPITGRTGVAVVVLPGGGYEQLAAHEGEGYANFLTTFGHTVFVVKYRVAPNRFPLPLLDARRAMRFVRYNAEKFKIDKEKILIMGSSAGGHLAAFTSTYLDKIEGEGVDEIDNEAFLPNGQILCYPVITSDEEYSHKGSYKNLLGERYDEREKYSPEKLVCEGTPKAFIWHTSEDDTVNVINSYLYASELRKNGIPHELHVYPHKHHGLGTSPKFPYIATWMELLRSWIIRNYQ